MIDTVQDATILPGYQQLVGGLDELSLSLSEQQICALLLYVQLFQKWCKAYNLSAIRDLEGIITLHILDSLSIANYVEGDRLIDVGTGAGLPGVPLAILNPEKSYVLLDSAGKKIRFLLEVKQKLALTNITPVNMRVEEYQPETLFDGVLSRAYSSVDKMLRSCGHLVHEKGIFCPMKGQYPKSELSQISPDYKLQAAYELRVPNLDAQRMLLKIVPK